MNRQVLFAPLGAIIVWNPTTEQWESARTEHDHGGLLLADLRTQAAAARANRECAMDEGAIVSVLCMGGLAVPTENKPAIATPMVREVYDLLEPRFRPRVSVLAERRSYSTATQLQALSWHLMNIGSEYDEVSIITNEYHVPRVRAMMDDLKSRWPDEFQGLAGARNLEIRGAEGLLNVDSYWRDRDEIWAI